MTATDRLLVLAPRGRDAQVIIGQLAASGTIALVASAADIVDAVRVGELAAAVIADEAMAAFDLDALIHALGAQPAWSDSPFIVLTRREFGGWTQAQLASLFGNVTLLERPLRTDVLVSGVRSALRARARQRRAQSYLLAREAAEAELAELAATLETRVEERTEALSRVLVERDHSQRRLRESEELYRYTIELTHQTPWTADAAGGLIAVGRGWVNRGGKTITDWATLVHADDLAGMLADWTMATAAAVPFLCDFRVTIGGGLVWCRARAAPRVAADGTVVRWYGTLENIDDRRVAANRLRQAQSELIHVSRLSAMGTMAATLAHELNQPLTAIANYVRGSRRLLGDYPGLAAVREGLDHADRNAMRAGDIIRRIRDQLTTGDVQRQPVDLSELVHEACALAMIDARASGVELCLDLAPAAIMVLADRIQIQQVLLNLLRNAAESVAGAATKHITITTAATSALHCKVTVRDTGAGISTAVAARLFEPFNSSKSGGMGIGLSISKTIIETHGGEIWYAAAAGGGAIFGFSLVRSPP